MDKAPNLLSLPHFHVDVTKVQLTLNGTIEYLIVILYILKHDQYYGGMTKWITKKKKILIQRILM